jgi:hypothetical protein
MDSSLKKIVTFIAEHHVMSLATSCEEELSACSLFYAYNAERKIFIFASSKDTKHIKHIVSNAKVAGNILLETQKVGEIKGLQFSGKCCEIQEKLLKLEYFKNFPYALALNPTLWQIEVESFKLTDNSFGFGKKILWRQET